MVEAIKACNVFAVACYEPFGFTPAPPQNLYKPRSVWQDFDGKIAGPSENLVLQGFGQPGVWARVKF